MTEWTQASTAAATELRKKNFVEAQKRRTEKFEGNGMHMMSVFWLANNRFRMSPLFAYLYALDSRFSLQLRVVLCTTHTFAFAWSHQFQHNKSTRVSIKYVRRLFYWDEERREKKNPRKIEENNKWFQSVCVYFLYSSFFFAPRFYFTFQSEARKKEIYKFLKLKIIDSIP